MSENDYSFLDTYTPPVATKAKPASSTEDYSFLDTYTPPEKKPSTGNLATDIPKAVARGISRLPDVVGSAIQTAGSGYAKMADVALGNENAGQGGAIENAVNSGVGMARDATTRPMADYVDEKLPYSQGTQESQNALNADIAKIGSDDSKNAVQKGLASLGAAVVNPRGSLPSVLESIPQFIGGAAALKAAKVAEGLSGLGKVSELAKGAELAAGLGQAEKAAELAKLASRAGAVQNTAIAGIGNAALEGEGAARGTRDDIMNMPVETLMQNPQFAQLSGQVGEEEARRITSETAASNAYTPAAVLGATASALTGGGLEGALMRGFKGTAEKGIVKAAIGGGGKEMLEEGMQGASGQMAQNFAEQPYTGVDLMSGVPEQVGMGAGMGLFSGGAGSAAGAVYDKTTQKPVVTPEAQAAIDAHTQAQAQADTLAQQASETTGALARPAAESLAREAQALADEQLATAQGLQDGTIEPIQPEQVAPSTFRPLTQDIHEQVSNTLASANDAIKNTKAGSDVNFKPKDATAIRTAANNLDIDLYNANGTEKLPAQLVTEANAKLANYNVASIKPDVIANAKSVIDDIDFTTPLKPTEINSLRVVAGDLGIQVDPARPDLTLPKIQSTIDLHTKLNAKPAPEDAISPKTTNTGANRRNEPNVQPNEDTRITSEAKPTPVGNIDAAKPITPEWIAKQLSNDTIKQGSSGTVGFNSSNKAVNEQKAKKWIADNGIEDTHVAVNTRGTDYEIHSKKFAEANKAKENSDIPDALKPSDEYNHADQQALESLARNLNSEYGQLIDTKDGGKTRLQGTNKTFAPWFAGGNLKLGDNVSPVTMKEVHGAVSAYKDGKKVTDKQNKILQKLTEILTEDERANSVESEDTRSDEVKSAHNVIDSIESGMYGNEGVNESITIEAEKNGIDTSKYNDINDLYKELKRKTGYNNTNNAADTQPNTAQPESPRASENTADSGDNGAQTEFKHGKNIFTGEAVEHDKGTKNKVQGSKPRPNGIKLEFESDLDKASYLAYTGLRKEMKGAGKNRAFSNSKEYTDYVIAHTGWIGSDVYSHGGDVQKLIAEQSKLLSEGDSLSIPTFKLNQPTNKAQDTIGSKNNRPIEVANIISSDIKQSLSTDKILKPVINEDGEIEDYDLLNKDNLENELFLFETLAEREKLTREAIAGTHIAYVTDTVALLEINSMTATEQMEFVAKLKENLAALKESDFPTALQAKIIQLNREKIELENSITRQERGESDDKFYKREAKTKIKIEKLSEEISRLELFEKSSQPTNKAQNGEGTDTTPQTTSEKVDEVTTRNSKPNEEAAAAQDGMVQTAESDSDVGTQSGETTAKVGQDTVSPDNVEQDGWDKKLSLYIDANRSNDGSSRRTAKVAKAGVTGRNIQSNKQRVDLPIFSEQENIASLNFDQKKLKDAEHILENVADAALLRRQAMLDEIALTQELERLAETDGRIKIENNKNGSVKYTVFDDDGKKVSSFTRSPDKENLDREAILERDKLRQQLVDIGAGKFEVKNLTLHVQPLDATSVNEMRDTAIANAKVGTIQQKAKKAADAHKAALFFDKVIHNLKSVLYALFKAINASTANKSMDNDNVKEYKFRNSDNTVMFTLQKGKSEFVLSSNNSDIKGANAREKLKNIALRERIKADIDRIEKESARRQMQGKIEAATSSANKAVVIDGAVQGMLGIDNELLQALFQEQKANGFANNFKGFEASQVSWQLPTVSGQQNPDLDVYQSAQAKKAQESRWISQQAEQGKPEPDAGKLDLESKIRESIKKNGTLHKNTQELGREYIDSYGQDEFSNFAKALSDEGLMNYKGADNGWHDNTLRDGNGGEVRSLRKFYSTNHKGTVEVSAYFDDDAEMYTPDGTESEPNNAKLFVIKGHYTDRYRLKNVDIDTVDDIASKLSKYRQSNPDGSSKDETAFLLSIGFKSGRFGYNSTFDGNNNGKEPDVEVTPEVKPKKPTPADKPVNQTNGDAAKSDMDKSYAQEMADLKAQMGDAIGNALSIIGGKMNMTEEDESKLLPIMAKIFRIAAKMIQLRFSRPANFEESAGYVMQQIRELADKESADKFTIQHLRGGYASNGGEDFEGMAKHKSTAELEAAYAKYVDGLINKAKDEIKAEKANSVEIDGIKKDSNLAGKDQIKPKTPRTKKQIEHAENVLDQSGVTGDLFAFVDESANLVNNGTITPETIHAAQTVEDLDNVLATALVEAKGTDNANQRTEVESTSTIEENVPDGAITQAERKAEQINPLDQSMTPWVFDMGFMGKHTYIADAPPKLSDGESIVSSKVIQTSTKIKGYDQKDFDMPREVNAWRVSVIKTLDNEFYSRIEFMGDNYYVGDKVQASFNSNSYVSDAISRIAPAIGKEAVKAYEKAVFNSKQGNIAQARNQTATQKPTHTLTTIDGESIPVYENDDGMWQSVAKNEDGYYQEFPKDDYQIDSVKAVSEDTNTITLDGKEIAVADVFKQLKGKAAERNQITELLNNHPDKQMVARIMAINEGVGTKNRTELPILEALVKLGRHSKENPRGFSMDC